jgi:hypothetical protein
MTSGHDAVPLTAESFAEVMPREHFARVSFQRCPTAECNEPTMIVHTECPRSLTGAPRYVFHIDENELSAIEIDAGRMVAGRD